MRENKTAVEDLENMNIVFESYNMAVEQSYNKVFSQNKPDDILKLREDVFDQSLELGLTEWANTPIIELDNKTPRDYFKGIQDFDQLIGMFKEGAMVCDKGLPQPLLEQLKSYGDKASDVLVSLAMDQELIHDGEKFLIPLVAINTLGVWREAGILDSLMKLLFSCSQEEEIIVEEIIGAFIKIGEPSIEPLLKAINQAQHIGYIEEHLLGALSLIGKTRRTDEIFKCLKNAFLRMEDKTFGAIYLRNYGDGRAVTVLRGFIEKNIDNIDYETFYEIKGAVQALNGNMDDISIPGGKF